MNDVYKEDLEAESNRPNKSEIKREIAVVQAMVVELAALSDSQLEQLHLPEKLYQALKEIADMPPKGARKRMLKYATGLLREIDLEPLKEALAKQKNQSAHAARQHHQVENWRERLIMQGDEALGELLNQYPDIDRQQLRQLIRNAKKEHERQQPPKYSRQLFRFLREALQAPSSV